MCEFVREQAVCFLCNARIIFCKDFDFNENIAKPKVLIPSVFMMLIVDLCNWRGYWYSQYLAFFGDAGALVCAFRCL